jgi:hypothetical protein
LRKPSLLKTLLASKILLVSLYVVSCKHPTPPAWEGKLYAGDSVEAAIVRAQSNERISCSDPQFDDYVCMSYSHYKSFIKTFVDGCVAWDKDAKVYIKKLDNCGLLTDKNIKIVKDCINETHP